MANGPHIIDAVVTEIMEHFKRRGVTIAHGLCALEICRTRLISEQLVREGFIKMPPGVGPANPPSSENTEEGSRG